MHTNNSARTRLILSTALAVIAALLLYRSALTQLVTSILHREGSSHGFFVPFIAAYLVWMNRDPLSRVETRFDLLGLPCLLGGLLIYAVSPDEGFRLQSISFFLVLGGLVWIFLGTPFFKRIAFPLFFLVTMIPLPWDIYLAIANVIRDVTYEISCWVTSLLGVPFHRDGYLISFPERTLEVATGCSGMRYLVSYLVFALAYAYLTREKIWSRILVVAAVFPLSIFATVCRLTIIFTATHWISPHAGDYKPHLYISWGSFLFVLFVSLLLDRIFLRKWDERNSSANKMGQPCPAGST